MITQKEMKSHFLSLKNAVYVWGANGQKITEALMDALYKSYGTSKYNREYYKNKLIEGLGRIGADCSGAFKKISGYDTTAAGYYNRAKRKEKSHPFQKTRSAWSLREIPKVPSITSAVIPVMAMYLSWHPAN